MLLGDSFDYEVITYAIESIPEDIVGMTCEIGLRRGGGTKYILDALAEKNISPKVHVGVDPYGNLDYKWLEGVVIKLDYTNSMRDESIGDIYMYACQHKINFIFLNLTDTEFFKRYSDGVPIYEEKEYILSNYIFVHFDGPHQVDELEKEFLWFNERMDPGATIVFDDVTFYDFEKLHSIITARGWKPLKFTQKKAAYQKIN